MHDPPIIDDDHCSRIQLYPVLCIGTLDRFLPFGCGIIPRFHIFRTPSLAEHAPILVVPFHLDEFAGDRVMLEYWLSEGAKQGAL